ncbi:hypothetical protein FHW16_005431 [Phyllobacterium myrsinacearum]|uniref:Uncharacterized protein n=1 Tax=Phyllobacterium myrsinacearum TaxID=28101 RepID=A0A839EWK4_9HYPH|nr:hypothetical protein [Phyllobacterium myrsinacearum]
MKETVEGPSLFFFGSGLPWYAEAELGTGGLHGSRRQEWLAIP